MKTIEYSDKLGHRSRRPWLLLVRGDEIRVFSGTTIDGWCAVILAQYERKGKWSGSGYQLAVADNVRAIAGKAGWETGTFREGAQAYSWAEAANYLGVSVPAAQDFLREWKPRAAEWYDEVERQLDAIDEVDGGAHTITVSFGAPRRRAVEAGYWDRPVIVRDRDGEEIAQLTPEQYAIEGTRVGDVIVQRSVHSPGPRGGHVSLTLVCPDGAVAEHEA